MPKQFVSPEGVIALENQRSPSTKIGGADNDFKLHLLLVVKHRILEKNRAGQELLKV